MNSHSEMRCNFRCGVPAFEQDLQFRLIAEADWGPFLALESLRPGGPRFICIDIAAIDPGYTIEIGIEDADSIGVQPGRRTATDRELRFLGVVATAEDGALTANLAAPVLLNLAAGWGVQSIQTASEYSPFTVILCGKERQAC